MHIHEVGIEHLSTGMEITPTAGHGVRIEASSASMFMVISDAPFTIFWPDMNVTVRSSNSTLFTPKHFDADDVTFYAQQLAQAMRDTHMRRGAKKSKLPSNR